MAIIQFGAIVTDARGKLGGHTFRKFRNTNVLQRTATVRDSDFFMKNQYLQKLNSISQAYRSLSVQEKGLVNSFAIENPIPNRFGNPTVLTARNMYQLLAVNLSTVSENSIDPLNLCNNLNQFQLEAVRNQVLRVQVSSYNFDSYLQIKAYITSKCINYYPTNLLVLQKKIPLISENITLDLQPYLSNANASLYQSAKLVVQLREVNTCGWAGMPHKFVFEGGLPIEI